MDERSEEVRAEQRAPLTAESSVASDKVAKEARELEELLRSPAAQEGRQLHGAMREADKARRGAAGDTIAAAAASQNSDYLEEVLEKTKKALSPEELRSFEQGWARAEAETRALEREAQSVNSSPKGSRETAQGKAPSIREVGATVAAQRKEPDRDRGYELEI